MTTNELGVERFLRVCYFPDGTCLTECLAGTYNTRQEADGTELGFCSPCDHACSTCTATSPRYCLTCSPGYLLQLCVMHCTTGYRVDQALYLLSITTSPPVMVADLL